MAGTGFGTGPFGIEPFGSPELVIQANAMLSKPSLRVLLELSITTPAMRIAT